MTKKEFNTTPIEKKTINRVIKNPPKRVSIAGEDDFSNDLLGTVNKAQSTKQTELVKTDEEKVVLEASSLEVKPNPQNKKTKAKQGRPIVYTDDRYRASKPKVISPALDSKLNILQDYIEELSTETGRITFEKIVDTLAESYIKRALPTSKEELLRSEIQQGFDALLDKKKKK